jgi:TetR/AcrR family fatty acid metabolism transcriptional regulator
MSISARKQREKEERIRLIADAGLQVFARHGYHKASMDMIAEQAELGKSTLYYYFKSKDDLLLAILEKGIGEFFKSLESSLGQAEDILQKIKEVTKVSARFFASYPEYFKLYTYLSAHPAYRSKIFNKLQKTIHSKIVMVNSLFAAAQAEGVIREDLSQTDIASIYGSMVMGMGFLSRSESGAEQLEKRAEIINKILFKGILK